MPDHLLLYIIVIVAIVRWLWVKRMAGAVLLDLGRFVGPSDKLKLIFGGACVLYGIASLFIMSTFGNMSFWLVIGGLSIASALSRRPIRENGLGSFDNFVKWSAIEAWVWAGEHESTLHLVFPGWFNGFGARFWGTDRWLIPPHLKVEVDRLLAAHVTPLPVSESQNQTSEVTEDTRTGDQ